MVTSMLEKAIEIEGLLRIIRDGNPLPETYILLKMKAAELADQADTLEEKAIAPESEKHQEEPAPIATEQEKQHAEPGDTPDQAPEAKLQETEKPHDDFVMVAPEPQKPNADFVLAPAVCQQPRISEVVFNAEHTEIEEDSLAHTIEVLSDLGEEDFNMTPEDLSLIEEDDILLSFEDTTEFPLPAANESLILIKEVKEENPAEAESTGAEASTESEATESIIMEPEAMESIIMEPERAESDSASEETPADIESSHKEPAIHNEATGKMLETAALSATKRQIKLKSAFSLNDRFLYARELFNGNMRMFDSTLDFLEGIEDYSIIEDYFYSELEWNPENTHVATFMDILRPHFKE